MLLLSSNFIKGFLYLLGLVPLKLLLLVARLGGWIVYFFNTGATKTTLANLKLAFPKYSEVQLQTMAKKSIIETIKTGLELGLAWRHLPSKNLSLYIEESGFKKITASLEKKEGLLIFSPHLSNIEMLMNFLGKNLDCMILYTPSKNKIFDKVMLDSRNKMGAKMVEPTMQGIKSLLRHLHEGGVVVIAPDQVPNKESGILSNFFSTPALTMTLVSKLKLKSGSPCHSVFCCRQKNSKKFYLEFSDEIQGMDINLQSSVDRMNEQLEECIMNAPEQYAWEYKRYKHSSLEDIY